MVSQAKKNLFTKSNATRQKKSPRMKRFKKRHKIKNILLLIININTRVNDISIDIVLYSAMDPNILNEPNSEVLC